MCVGDIPGPASLTQQNVGSDVLAKAKTDVILNSETKSLRYLLNNLTADSALFGQGVFGPRGMGRMSYAL